MSLCRRCEKRATAYETGFGPRYECTDFEHSKVACYCYEPVKPVILQRLAGDKRPQFAGWAISARSQFVGIEDKIVLDIIRHGTKGNTLIWKRKVTPALATTTR